MDAVMISINPKWVQKILRGEKTIEIRKKAPKISGAFKCYIYCTLGGDQLSMVNGVVQDLNSIEIPLGDNYKIDFLNGFVVGEFICKEVIPIKVFGNGLIQNYTAYGIARSCVPYDDIVKYIGNGCSGYGWKISHLKIYDKPKKVTDFYKPCITPNFPYCPDCPVGGEYISDGELEALAEFGECRTEWYCNNVLRKPPQSWCYVKEQIE